MKIWKIVSLIDSCNAKRALLLCHHNADPDAICSAFAFSQLLKRLRPELNIEVAAAQGPSRLSKTILKSIPMTLTDQPRIEEADVIAFLDTNTIQQLDGWRERIEASKASLIVIDHHANHTETERLSSLSVADETASSTCEIVYRLFGEAGVKLSPIEAKALFLGIAFDTRRFMLASSETMKILAELTETGVKNEETLALLSLPMDPSERMARLKAAKRAKLSKTSKWLLAFTHVSAYQASAARALLMLGAHVAVVGGHHGERIQVSMRAKREFHEKTGVHLGRDVAKPLGQFLQGMGGGHAVSAGANGTGSVEASLERSISLIKEKLMQT